MGGVRLTNLISHTDSTGGDNDDDDVGTADDDNERNDSTNGCREESYYCVGRSNNKGTKGLPSSLPPCWQQVVIGMFMTFRHLEEQHRAGKCLYSSAVSGIYERS